MIYRSIYLSSCLGKLGIVKKNEQIEMGVKLGENEAVSGPIVR
jgi:hypothetical protein